MSRLHRGAGGDARPPTKIPKTPPLPFYKRQKCLEMLSTICSIATSFVVVCTLRIFTLEHPWDNSYKYK